MVVASLQEEVDTGVVCAHEVHCLYVIDELLWVHEGKADVLHELWGILHAAVFESQPAACSLEQVQLCAALQAVAGQHEGQSFKRELDKLSRAQKRRKVLQDEVVDIFIHLSEVIRVGYASDLYAVVEGNLEKRGRNE